MSWAAFIKRITTQTAVYWGNPQNDGDGGKTFDAPIEIPCRWESMTDLKQMAGSDSEEGGNTTNTKVITRQKLDINGYLFLGTLADLPASPNDPVAVNNAFKIIMPAHVPTISGREMHYEYLI